MADRLSSGWSVDAIVGGWRGCSVGKVAPCACASSVWLRLSCEDFLGDLPHLLAAPAGADVGRNGPVLGDDGLGFGGFDGTAVGVADDLGHLSCHDRPGPLGEVGGDDTQG